MFRKLGILTIIFFAIIAGCDPHELEFLTTDEIRQLEKNKSSIEINRLLDARARVNKIHGFETYSIRTGWKSKPASPKINGSQVHLDDADWELTEVGFKWYEIDFARWFRKKIRIPNEIGGFKTMGQPVFVYISINDDEQVWIDGKLRQDYDAFAGNVLLTDSAVPGEEFLVAIKGLNGPGKGELRQVALRLGPVTAMQEQLDSLKTRISVLARALMRLPNVQYRWINGIDDLITKIGQVTALRNIDQIQARLAHIERKLTFLENDHADYPAVVVAPYLQAVTQTEATIMWETDLEADSEVRWGETADYENKEIFTRKTKMHEVRLTGLKPETTYFYRVRSNKIISPGYAFRTAPKPETPFKFAVWGDSHHGTEITERLAQLALSEGAELLVQPGDAVNHGSSQQQWYEQFFQPLRHFAASHPVYLAAGNHEYGGYWDTQRPLLFEKYLKHPGNPYWFSFEYGNAFFIILDPNQSAPPFDIPPESEQYRWLVDELNSDAFKRSTWHFVVFHQPPFAECWSGGYYDGEAGLRKNIVPLLEQYPVDFVFSGHAHAYERGRWPKSDGPFYIITGGGGGSIDDEHYKDWPQIDVYHQAHHFCLLEIDGAKLTFRAITPENQIIDLFETTPRTKN